MRTLSASAIPLRAGWLAFAVLAAALIISSLRPANAATKPEELVEKATLTIEKLLVDPNLPELRGYVEKSQGILIIPQLVKGGFLVGGEGGSGVLLIKGSDGTWSSPAFYTLAAGSFGLQIGAQVSEVVFTIMNDGAVNALLDDSFKLGGDRRQRCAVPLPGQKAGAKQHETYGDDQPNAGVGHGCNHPSCDAMPHYRHATDPTASRRWQVPSRRGFRRARCISWVLWQRNAQTVGVRIEEPALDHDLARIGAFGVVDLVPALPVQYGRAFQRTAPEQPDRPGKGVDIVTQICRGRGLDTLAQRTYGDAGVGLVEGLGVRGVYRGCYGSETRRRSACGLKNLRSITISRGAAPSA